VGNSHLLNIPAVREKYKKKERAWKYRLLSSIFFVLFPERTIPMPIALYPGTFDPITFGHIDIAVRAAKIFGTVIAVIADNPNKNPFFAVEERLEMAREALGHVDNIKVIPYKGLIAHCLREHRATVLIRGLRALSDFEYEFQMAFTNRNINEDAETVFLMPSAQYSYLNSTIVKQISKFGGDVGAFVPEGVGQRLAKKYRQINGW
jgi:pantetheine-phosphate adenylyltransferase